MSVQPVGTASELPVSHPIPHSFSSQNDGPGAGGGQRVKRSRLEHWLLGCCPTPFRFWLTRSSLAPTHSSIHSIILLLLIHSVSTLFYKNRWLGEHLFRNRKTWFTIQHWKHHWDKLIRHRAVCNDAAEQGWHLHWSELAYNALPTLHLGSLVVVQRRSDLPPWPPTQTPGSLQTCGSMESIQEVSP